MSRRFRRMLASLFDRRRWRFLWQRWTRGWDDSVTWSLDHEIAKFVLPRLKRFVELNHCYPNGMTFGAWKNMLDDMVFAMEYIAAGKQWSEFDREKEERVQRGCKLFGRYFMALWW